MEKEQKQGKYVSVAELAKMLGISRIAVFKKIKKGQILAEKIGRSYVISNATVAEIFQKSEPIELTDSKKSEISEAVKKTIREYGETLRLLGRE